MQVGECYLGANKLIAHILALDMSINSIYLEGQHFVSYIQDTQL